LSIDIYQRKGDEVGVRIADTGRGMTAAEQARIFEPFYTRFEGGRGLGLAVVRQIVDSYAGRIDLASELRIGTEITITLPTRPAAKAARAERTAEAA
jgi:signal transduction histidine kinase